MTRVAPSPGNDFVYLAPALGGVVRISTLPTLGTTVQSLNAP